MFVTEKEYEFLIGQVQIVCPCFTPRRAFWTRPRFLSQTLMFHQGLFMWCQTSMYSLWYIFLCQSCGLRVQLDGQSKHGGGTSLELCTSPASSLTSSLKHVRLCDSCSLCVCDSCSLCVSVGCMCTDVLWCFYVMYMFTSCVVTTDSSDTSQHPGIEDFCRKTLYKDM